MDMRVLLVDDHPLFRDGIASLLETRGMEIVGEASDGREAVDKAQELEPDLILMDVHMPEMNGVQATRVIKAEMPATRIVMLTVSEDEADLFEAIKSGADGYLLKSLRAEDFFEMVEGVARGEAALSRSLASKIIDEFARQSYGEAPEEEGEKTLTDREMEVLELVAEGLTNKEIASALYITQNTVKYHMKNILGKLHAQNRAEAVAYAIHTGLLEGEREPKKRG